MAREGKGMEGEGKEKEMGNGNWGEVCVIGFRGDRRLCTGEWVKLV